MDDEGGAGGWRGGEVGGYDVGTSISVCVVQEGGLEVAEPVAWDGLVPWGGGNGLREVGRRTIRRGRIQDMQTLCLEIHRREDKLPAHEILDYLMLIPKPLDLGRVLREEIV